MSSGVLAQGRAPASWAAADPAAHRCPVLRARELFVHFDRGATKALDGVDLEIGEAELVAIVGPSGCGKSTLLNAIGALDRPTSGEIYFRSTPYSKIGDGSLFRREHIGFVFQSFNLIPTLSALDNVLVPTIGVTGPRVEHERRACALLERLGVRARSRYFPPTLSGGERQRVAIARALINSPDVILADEPTGSLDSASATEVLDLLGDIREQQGITVVVVTHDPTVSSRADRVVRLRDGRIDARKEPRP